MKRLSVFLLLTVGIFAAGQAFADPIAFTISQVNATETTGRISVAYASNPVVTLTCPDCVGDSEYVKLFTATFTPTTGSGTTDISGLLTVALAFDPPVTGPSNTQVTLFDNSQGIGQDLFRFYEAGGTDPVTVSFGGLIGGDLYDSNGQLGIDLVYGSSYAQSFVLNSPTIMSVDVYARITIDSCPTLLSEGNSTPVPEPASLLLIGTGLGLMGVAVRRKRK